MTLGTQGCSGGKVAALTPRHHVWLIDTSGSAFELGYLQDSRYGTTIRHGLGKLRSNDTYSFIAYDSTVRHVKSRGVPGQTVESMFEALRKDFSDRIGDYEKHVKRDTDGRTRLSPGEPRSQELRGTDLKAALSALELDIRDCGNKRVTVTCLTDGAWDPVDSSRDKDAPEIKASLNRLSSSSIVERIELVGLDEGIIKKRQGAKTLWLEWLGATPKRQDLDWFSPP